MKAQLLLFFNIEGYGEFFSGITPEQLQNLIEKIVETVIKLMPFTQIYYMTTHFPCLLQVLQ